MANANVNPVFVLGLNRNGTTWLTNLLLKHPAIVGAQHWLHHGAHETGAAAYQRYLGWFRDYDSYASFMGAFALDDLFRLADGDLAQFLERQRHDFYEVYFDLMDAFAHKQGATYWAAKMDPTLLWHGGLDAFWARLTARYDAPRVIGIMRDDDAALRSYMRSEGMFYQKRRGPGRYLAPLLGYARQVAGRRTMAPFLAGIDAPWVAYGDLRRDIAAVEAALDTYLGVSQSLGTDQPDPYAPNSSFAETPRATEPLPGAAIYRGVARIPGLAHGLLRSWDKLKRRPPQRFHRLTKLEHCPEALKAELAARGSPLQHHVPTGQDG